MKKFILTRINLEENLEDIKKLLYNIVKLGFSGVFLTVKYSNYKQHKHIINKLIATYQNSIDIAVRIEIDEDNKNKIKNILTTIRKKVDIISVTPNKKDLMAFVCRDGRIDIVNVTQNNFNLFTDNILRICRENNKVVEFNLVDLLYTWGEKRVRILGKLKTVTKRVARLHVQFLITVSPFNFYDLRKPIEIVHIGRLLGFSVDKVKESISVIPLELLEKNREKRKPDFILPGVRIVKHQQEEEQND